MSERSASPPDLFR